MLTGMPGWHKRIQRNFKSVAKTTQLNDDVCIDPTRDAAGLMYTAARKAVLKTPSTCKIGKEVGALEHMLMPPESKTKACPEIAFPSSSGTTSADRGDYISESLMYIYLV